MRKWLVGNALLRDDEGARVPANHRIPAAVVARDAVGLPAFQFIQDPLEYGTRTHHSNMDVYDHLSANDLEQASAVMAWFVYSTASRPEMLPRNCYQSKTKV
jgi:hypothetical protein